MNSLEANIRNNKTKGELNAIRKNGEVPGIVYGGKDENQKVSISKKKLKYLIEKENFLSNIIILNVGSKNLNVLPREVKYHILSDEPTHVDFLRILPGVKIKIEVPVNFINHEKSPGLKRGGVLNIVRRKIELKCPSEKIPDNITIDLNKLIIQKKSEQFKINNTEKIILEKMINNPGKTFSRENIGILINLDKERSIDVIITRLRKKIEDDPKNPKFLQTMRGAGYVLWIK